MKNRARIIHDFFVALCMPFASFPAHAGEGLQDLATERAYEYFLELLSVPRGSGNEKAASDHLMAFAKSNSLDAVQDSALNVLIRKPGSPGRENETPVILQAHMDIVCEKNEDVAHDFLKDPIIPVIDGEWIGASGTTLGADNGAGISIIMAVLAAVDLSHPPIEAVITTEEETGMGGAGNFDASLLAGKRFINLDSEGEGVLTVSCAGSAKVVMTIPAELEPAPEGSLTYKMKVKGLTGGHSGVDIDKGRANANILMARLLDALDDGTVYVTDIGGGSRANAIPRECTARISFDGAGLDKVKSIVARAETEFKAEYAS
ncbi:MAG: M20/M25/M40 family metallo-hydrolase, partial [Synergistaceae bacterium]|nr:M20/M25/M40 family metallo-hydrolase [Synergistaceae bacterium]